MAKVTVYPFWVWDQTKGEHVPSTRMGTREGIARIDRSTIIAESPFEIDEALLGREEPGLTDRNFDPAKG